MGLHKFKPMPSGRMGILWTLASVKDAALVEYGCMGHMLYARAFLNRAGVPKACNLYSTHIDETDIALGGIERIRKTVDCVAKNSTAKVIFLLPSSVPQIIGTDLPAICEELQPEYPNIRLLPFGYGGFDITQHRGIQEALLLLARTLPVKAEKTREHTFNIVGSCADLFNFHADANEIVRIMEGSFNMKPLCIMTSDASVEDIEKMGGAHINLVLRREGEPAAKQLQNNFETPYYLGRPYGIEGTIQWIENIARILNITPDRDFIDSQREEALRLISSVKPTFRHLIHDHPEKVQLSLGTHADVVNGILGFGCDEFNLPKGTCWCDSREMSGKELPYFTEEQLMQNVSEQKDGILMASGELLEWTGRNRMLQISNPDEKWRINPYVPPFVGFRGALHLVELWVNEAMSNNDKT
ncbi:nitrogenase component 1 [Sedimentibacter sp.]|uniref:nitrogenase component 1 n=1 Tax=Sedimentibacter sp. TaxID=1960295 RepID=UPI0028A7B028|nr:nitrogenase component 1 [Sedimentibacter sp.]